jgi:hypothetical protein
VDPGSSVLPHWTGSFGESACSENREPVVFPASLEHHERNHTPSSKFPTVTNLKATMTAKRMD